MRKLLLSALAALLLAAVPPAHAQKTKAQMTTEINSLFADNTTGQITPLKLRTVANDIVNSYVDWLVCTGTGGLVYWNAGTPTCLTAGAAGTLLQSNGTLVAPSWFNIGTLLAAGNSINITGTNPFTIALSSTPILGVATGTSLALNGATLGTNALAVAGTSLFTGVLSDTSTTAPTSTAGSTFITGSIAFPTLAANGQAVYANATTVGAGIQGQGSTGDVSLINKNAAVAAYVPTGTTNFNVVGDYIFGSGVSHSASTYQFVDSGSAAQGGNFKCMTVSATYVNCPTAGIITLGTAGSTVGNLVFVNATSGSITLAPTTGALGSITQTLQAITGTIPVNIAIGTSALGTSAIASGACASVVTTAATGTATTDVIDFGFNGDPTATTGYIAPNMLAIIAYPSANNVNFKVCNNTGSSITPGAITLNWKVRR